MNKQKENKKIYENTLKLFDYRCAICGNNQVHCHHIRYGGIYGGRKTYIGNIIPLCKKHHDLVHTNKKYYMQILIDIVDERLKNES